MYDVLVLIHILSAMAWVGGGFMLVTLERHAHKVGGPSALTRMMDDHQWADDWIFTPAPLLTVVTGVTMVIMSDAWAFSQPWVYLALTLVAAEFGFGYRDYKRVKDAKEKGPDALEFAEALRGYLRMAPLAIAMLAAVVFLMVFKPGA
jgi:uncharacterized membrane protein